MELKYIEVRRLHTGNKKTDTEIENVIDHFREHTRPDSFSARIIRAIDQGEGNFRIRCDFIDKILTFKEFAAVAELVNGIRRQLSLNFDFTRLLKSVSTSRAVAMLDTPTFQEMRPDTACLNMLIGKKEIPTPSALAILDDPRFSDTEADVRTLTALINKKDVDFTGALQILRHPKFASITQFDTPVLGAIIKKPDATYHKIRELLTNDSRFEQAEFDLVIVGTLLNMNLAYQEVLEILEDPRNTEDLDESILEIIAMNPALTIQEIMKLFSHERLAPISPTTLVLNMMIRRKEVTYQRGLELINIPYFVDVLTDSYTVTTLLTKPDIPKDSEYSVAMELLGNPRFAEVKWDAILLKVLIRKAIFDTSLSPKERDEAILTHIDALYRDHYVHINIPELAKVLASIKNPTPFLIEKIKQFEELAAIMLFFWDVEAQEVAEEVESRETPTAPYPEEPATSQPRHINYNKRMAVLDRMGIPAEEATEIVDGFDKLSFSEKTEKLKRIGIPKKIASQIASGRLELGDYVPEL